MQHDTTRVKTQPSNMLDDHMSGKTKDKKAGHQQRAIAKLGRQVQGDASHK
jgi:hypothetical protein